MNTALALLHALVFSATCCAMEITLPDRETIKSRFMAIGLKDYLDKTHLDQQLAFAKLAPRAVAAQVELVTNDYFGNSVLRWDARQKALSKKYTMVKVLLQDEPAALSVLEEDGYFDNDEN